ncbi:MAG: helix-turn-helix transcriptional regulator [Dehalococcoidia bacterium]
MPGDSDVPLVGRQGERALLLERLEHAAAGDARLVLIAGEPGIGKSRLLAEVADQAKAAGWLVLGGRAYESEGLPPYLPFTVALRDVVRGLSLDELGEQVGTLVGGIAAIVPEAVHQVAHLPPSAALSPEHERYRLFERVTELLLFLARRQSSNGRQAGVLLILDDLQWADRPSLLLLQHLARGIAGAPMLVAGAYRTVDLRRTHPLTGVLAELRRERLADRIRLGGLDRTDTAALIAAISGTSPADDVVDAIADETEGNPFFVEEIVRHLQAEHRDLTSPDAIADRGEIPEGIREVIGARLSRLSAATNRALHVAAVLGDGFEFDLLREVSAIDGGEPIDALDEAITAGVLREVDGRFNFRHVLIRQTVHAEVSLPRRQQFHLRAAQAMEALARVRPAPDVAAIAMHYRLAGRAADPDTTIRAAIEAANAAAARYAWEDAAGHWSTVVELLPAGDARRRCEALLTLGEMQQRAGDLLPAEFNLEEAARLARRLGAADLLARAALSYGLGDETGGLVPERSRRTLEEARAALGNEDSALLSRVLARLSWQQLRAELLDDRRELSAEAVDVARRVGDPVTLAHALCARHWGLTGPEAHEERLAIADEIIAVAGSCDDRELLLAGHFWRLMDLLEAGEIHEADREISAYAALAEPLRQPYYGWYVPLMHGMQALRDGRLAEAERQAHEAMEIGRRGQERLSRMHHAVQATFILDALGRTEEALAAARTIVDEQPDLTPGQVLYMYQLQRSGRPDEARALVRALAEDDFGRVSRDEDWLMIVMLLGLTCAELDEPFYAARIYQILRPYPHLCTVLGNAAVWLGPVERALGLLAAALGRTEEAIAHLETAAAITERVDARPLLASIRYELASVLFEAETDAGRARAVRLLHQVHDAAEEIGMPLLAERAAAALAHSAHVAGIPVGRPAGGPDGLTEREVEVLRLVASGHTNREVADTLVLSVRTVERHIAHIYAKTNARGRADATLYAVRHSLVSDVSPE